MKILLNRKPVEGPWGGGNHFLVGMIEECEKRDPKGLYKKARSGKLKNFTGIDSNYEIPSSPEIILETKIKSAEELADEVILYLKQYNKI